MQPAIQSRAGDGDSEDTVSACLKQLQENHLAQTYWPAGSPRDQSTNAMRDVLSLDDAALSVLTLLLLRGPQTCGELRNRTAQMYPFASPEVLSAR